MDYTMDNEFDDEMEKDKEDFFEEDIGSELIQTIDNITIKIKYVGHDEIWIGRRNIYDVVLTDKKKRSFSFVFYDSPIKTQTYGVFHDELLCYVLNTLLKQHYIESTKLQNMLSKKWIDGIEVFLKIDFLQ